MDKIEQVTDEVTGEVKAVKIGAKEYTPEQFDALMQTEDKYKSLQAEFTKRNQEQKGLMEEIEEYRKFDKMLEEKPDVAEKVRKLLEGAEEAAGEGTKKGNDAAEKALAKVEALTKQLEDKDKNERMERTYTQAKTMIETALDAEGITNARIRKMVVSDMFTDLMREQKSPEQLKADVKAAVMELNKMSDEKLEALKSASKKKQPVVPGKGGAGGVNSNEKRPLPGTKEWREFVAKKREEHFQSD